MNITPIDLTPFWLLMAEQLAPVREEVQANKAFHLGAKEFEYVATLAGDVPQREVTEARARCVLSRL